MSKIYKVIYSGGTYVPPHLKRSDISTVPISVNQLLRIQRTEDNLYEMSHFGIECQRSLIKKGFYLFKDSKRYYFVEFGGFIKNSIHSIKDFTLMTGYG